MATHAAQHRNHTVDQSVSQDPRQAQPTKTAGESSVRNPNGDYPLFVALLAEAGFPAPTPEYYFALPRRWHADYAYPIERILIEFEGGVWSQGRHTRGGGYIRDIIKYNEAALLGYRVLRFTPNMLMDGSALDTIRRAFRQRSAPHDRDTSSITHNQDLAASTTSSASASASASTATPVTAPTSSATAAESRTSVWTSASPDSPPAPRHRRS